MPLRDEGYLERQRRANNSRRSTITREQAKDLMRKAVKQLGSVRAVHEALPAVNIRTVWNWYYGAPIGSSYVNRVTALGKPKRKRRQRS